MNELEIEDLLFKQVSKPKHFLMTKIINVFENRYRVNIYIEIEEDNLIKKRISNSYFCHYSPGKLIIIPEPDKKDESRINKSISK
jgi:hypothetical protein